MSKDATLKLFRQVKEGKLSRREFVRRALALGVSLSAVGPLLQSSALAQENVTLQWWDQFLPLEALEEQTWARYTEENPNVRVQYTYNTPNSLGESLPLAYRSNQAPDVHTLAGLGVPIASLVSQGWFTPLEPQSFFREQPVLQGNLYEGLSVFGGQVYSFPLFDSRWYLTGNWFNKQMMEDAGFDPNVGPRTWDDVRQAANAITQAGDGRVYGIYLPLANADQIEPHVLALAQVAGAPGGIDWQTGEYVYDSDEFVQAVEFLLSFQQDGSLSPESTALIAGQARGRWAVGSFGMFFDGPWNLSVVQLSYPDFMDSFGVAQIPVPVLNTPSFTHVGPPGSIFFVSSQSEHPDIASEILQLYTTEEFQVGLAELMDQPPLNPNVLARADVHPTYRQNLEYCAQYIRIAPVPEVRNQAVTAVLGEMRNIQPGLGDLVQGAFVGGVSDIRAALRQYNDQLTAERERAIGVVNDQGLEVSVDDWVFSNWQPDQDYLPEDYENA